MPGRGRENEGMRDAWPFEDKRMGDLGEKDGQLMASGTLFITSRPKARDGLRYPCPAKRFINGCFLGSGPEGDEVL